MSRCVALALGSARQVELSSARERYDAAAGEAAAAVREGTRLRQALTSMEARLSDFQRKDVEVSPGCRSWGWTVLELMFAHCSLFCKNQSTCLFFLARCQYLLIFELGCKAGNGEIS